MFDTTFVCPPLVPISQHLPRRHVHDVEAEARRQAASLLAGIRPGARIAITAGSRGINDIVPVLRGAVAAVRLAGGEPIIVGAMGSHGGGTVEGQLKILHDLNIMPETVGAQVYTGTDVVSLGLTPSGLNAWCDSVAASCDGIIVCNRVKVHTLFREPFGSGMQKMMAIGLGKVRSAEPIHRRGLPGMVTAIAEIAAVTLASGKVLGGLAIVENGYDETAIVEGMPANCLVERELALFEQANALMPRLPVGNIDVLIVEEMGKNISGTGMDPNITGRWRLPGVSDPPFPNVKRLVVLRLTHQSEGNATGIGGADVTTQALFSSIDRTSTYLNAITSTFVERVAIPMIMPTDEQAIAAALKTAGNDPATARIVRIPNTLHLENVWVSENLLGEAEAGGQCEAIGPARPLVFDEDGQLAPA
jgi:hypothetical protein